MFKEFRGSVLGDVSKWRTLKFLRPFNPLETAVLGEQGYGSGRWYLPLVYTLLLCSCSCSSSSSSRRRCLHCLFKAGALVILGEVVVVEYIIMKISSSSSSSSSGS